MGRDKEYPLTPELESNLTRLLTALNGLREAYGKPMVVSSGYRPEALNKKIGGAKNSKHMTCRACDFRDVDGMLDKFCCDNTELLSKLGLYIEHPRYTNGWCHLEIDGPKSGMTKFVPYTRLPNIKEIDEKFPM